MNFVATPDNIQVSYLYVVANLKLCYPDDQIKMPNLNVIVDPAFPHIDNA
jgi:hypothetical protein